MIQVGESSFAEFPAYSNSQDFRAKENSILVLLADDLHIYHQDKAGTGS
jgi:hypothetical protein